VSERLARVALLAAAALHAFTAAAAEAPPEPTALVVSDEVLRREIRRFGVNLGEDRWYHGAIFTRERVLHGGFEGMLYRQLTFGPSGDAQSYVDWFPVAYWERLLVGARAWFVTGPRKGQPTRVVRIGRTTLPDRPDAGELAVLHFADAGPVPAPNDGLFLEKREPDVGYVGQNGVAFWVFIEGGGRVRTVAGDVPPGSAGRVAVLLEAPGTATAAVQAPALLTPFAAAEGTWRLRFWARGAGTLRAYVGDYTLRGRRGVIVRPVALEPAWRRHEVVFEIAEYRPETLAVGLEASGGSVRLDEISFVRDGERNSTAFRDDLVDALRGLRPGVLRHLQIGGSSLDNLLAPRAARLAFSHGRWDRPPDSEWPGVPEVKAIARFHSYSLPEFLELCREVGAEPWYSTPGTFTPEEMRGLIEFLAGPSDSPYGRVRAEAGREEPWSRAFERIHLEIGNEAWNGIADFRHGGYSEKGEYWSDLFRAARSSPHFTPKILLHAGGQASSPGRNERLVAAVPEADRIAVAPYLLNELERAQAAWDDERFFGFALAAPWFGASHGPTAETFERVTRAHGVELSVYEVNHHVTGGDAPEAARNRLATSIGGGLNVAHWMLLWLERFGARTQALFTLAQYDAAADVGRVRLWGAVASLRGGAARARPTLLAVSLVNRVLAGDLVRVRKRGPDPTWAVRASYWRQPPRDLEVPYLHAFATRDGSARGLVAFNLHRRSPLDVQIELPGEVAPGSAVAWTLAAERIDASNELDGEPGVRVRERPLPELRSGARFELPPFSLTVIAWRQRG
jgi:alpha-L-arabinofuranosidase